MKQHLWLGAAVLVASIVFLFIPGMGFPALTGIVGGGALVVSGLRARNASEDGQPPGRRTRP